MQIKPNLKQFQKIGRLSKTECGSTEYWSAECWRLQKARSENIERRLRQQMEVDIQIIENEHQSSTSTSAPGLSTVTSEKPLSEKLRECHEARDRRIATFLEFIRRRRDEHIASILATRQQSLTT